MKRYRWNFGLFSGCLAWVALFSGGGAWAADAQPRPNPLRSSSSVSPTSATRPVAADERAAAQSSPSQPRSAAKPVVVPRPAAHSGSGPQLRPALTRMAAREAVSRESVLVAPPATETPATPMPMPGHSAPLEHPSMTEVIEGDMVFESDPYLGDVCGTDFGCCDEPCVPCCLIPCPLFSTDNLQIFGGAHGFTGPVNRGETASFGFHEGFNWGAPMLCAPDLGAKQFGVRATQTNFSGADSTSENRNQIFLTGGYFRRVDWGVQCGLVVDYMSDDWYYSTDLLQLRGELSWVFPCSHEIGFWFTNGLNSDSAPSVLDRANVNAVERWEATDLYAFFYRHRFDECAQTEGRFYAGFSGESDGLLGADLRMPMNDRVAVAAGFTYLIPNEGEGAGVNFGHAQESWNLGVSLVWYPGCGGSRSADYARPLFDVADNGSFMVDRDN